MAGFNPTTFILKLTLLVLISTAFANAQQNLGGIKQSSVIVDYSVIESLGPAPNVPLQLLRKPGTGARPANSYSASTPKSPPTSGGQSSVKAGVINLKPPKSPRKPAHNQTKRERRATSKTFHAARPATGRKLGKVRPLAPPRLLKPPKAITAPPPPKFLELLPKPVPPPPAIPTLLRPTTAKKFAKSVTLPPSSPIKATPPNALPTAPKFARPTTAPETRVGSLSQTGQPAKLGSTIHIGFSAGSFELNTDAFAKLKPVSTALKKNSRLRIQLLAYASSKNGSAIKAKRLALSRALAARSHLIDNGVGITRIAVKALGNQSGNGPADRIDIILTTR